ncbi:hypothetical protein O181_133238, partial [Austropuccinia psidii MF-1]|nr:hypothetical protein [Austropuccinia psidii MF-1]
MSPVHLRELRFPRKQLEGRIGLFESRRSGFEHHGEWEDTQKNHTEIPIKLPLQKTPQTRGH